jgi:hypothetical protein
VFGNRKAPSGGPLQGTVSSVAKNVTSLETVFHPVTSEDPIVSGDDGDRDGDCSGHEDRDGHSHGGSDSEPSSTR